MGRDLTISDTRVEKEQFRATINGTFKLPIKKSDINIYIVNQTPYIQVKPKITGKVVSTSENFDTVT